MLVNNSRFTLLCFPQSIDATGKLRIHIAFLPRNINPLEPVNTMYNPAGAPAFAQVQPVFSVKVVTNPNEFPGTVPAAPYEVLPPVVGGITYSARAGDIYTVLKNATRVNESGNVVSKYFDIDENRSSDRSVDQEDRPAAAVDKGNAIRKYLPLSYRNAFNFTAPRIPNAVVDDSYHCAVRDKEDPGFKKSDNKVSWGKVYAHLMRQPHIAKQAGLIYEVTVQLDPTDLEKGGWIYCDILSGDYSAEQTASEVPGKDPFIKKYAARIPSLKPGEARSLFAAVLFPVLQKGSVPDGNFDDIFIEAARYAEGFAGLVHSFQPVSQNLLEETADGFHPQKEIGIRLGWDDEQILVWYLRQLAKEESTASGDRIDAPLGISGYNVDVRLAGTATWESLTQVRSNGDLTLEEDINMGGFSGELPYQVYPTKLGSSYWLPMYFVNWNDQSIVLPDKRAADIYANASDEKLPAQLSDSYSAPDYSTKLKYGHAYEFRVRMLDLTGGGPGSDVEPDINMPGHMAKTVFKRYVAPGVLLLRHSDTEYKPNTDDVNFNRNQLHIQRPLLSYPAVLYTGLYSEADALQRLRDNRDNNFALQRASRPIDGFGIPDLDVVKVQVKIEVETLKMDNLLSDSGREHYITLYTTYRHFNPADPDDLLSIPIDWIDQHTMDLGNMVKPFDNDTDNANKDGLSIVLPRGRNIRMTLRACCEGAENYWGDFDSKNPDADPRLGKVTVLSMRREAMSERGLLAGTEDPAVVQAIFLQPDPYKIRQNAMQHYTWNGNNQEHAIPDIVKRLAGQLHVDSKELTLTAPLGERMVFWCSNLIRHNLAPDASSITFSGTNELSGHWLVCTTLYIDRDWSWDSLDTLGFVIERKRKQGRDERLMSDLPWQPVGSMDMQRVAGYQAIQQGSDGKIHREYTKLIFIDVVDGKPPAGETPDVSDIQYRITPRLKKDLVVPVDDPFETPLLQLPTISNPVQMPKLIGAGIALSPYIRNVPYSKTEPRTRYLWLEFEKMPDDPNDDIFARVLAYAPDQLISNNDPELLTVAEESTLPVDPEYIRVVIPSSGHEHAGLNAMQPLKKSVDNGRHFYLLPMPPGLHHESPELFGFFTYEFRYGHSDRIWSTAQARFGRSLRIAGLQHPAPNMLPVVDRDKKRILVQAPYAKTVYQGKNVTSDPPRTSIWCLLYAQVKQADGLDNRNILLDERKLVRPLRERHKELYALKMQQAGHDNNLIYQIRQEYNLTMAREKEATWQAVGEWSNKEVAELLYLYGLPSDAALSVICVEVFGQITNIREHINDLDNKRTALYETIAKEYDQQLAEDISKVTNRTIHDSFAPEPATAPDPLKSQLGYHRILRTSPLTEVPFICCADCD